MWEAAKDWVQEKMGKKTEQKVEMVGWGVEEAQERHDEEASMDPHPYEPVVLLQDAVANDYRLGNTDGVGVRHSQKLHLCSDTIDGSGHPQGCQDPPVVGLEYRQACPQVQIPMKDRQRPHGSLTPRSLNELAHAPHAQH